MLAHSIAVAALVFSSGLCATGCGGGDHASAAPQEKPAAAPKPAACPKVDCPACEAATACDGALKGDSPDAQALINVWSDMSAGRWESVWQRLEQPLAQQLSPERLADILKGVEETHGNASLVDAWGTTIKEEQGTWRASAGLLRMAKSTIRFRLLLVYNANNSIRGFWLKPI